MGNLLYLICAIGVASLVITILWIRNRKPKTMRSAIEGFQRELRALAPDQRGQHRGGRRTG